MTISRYCIDRPIFASVVSIVITLAGAVAMFNLPVAQYPDITPVQITVSASYPGASAEVSVKGLSTTTWRCSRKHCFASSKCE